MSEPLKRALFILIPCTVLPSQSSVVVEQPQRKVRIFTTYCTILELLYEFKLIVLYGTQYSTYLMDNLHR